MCWWDFGGGGGVMSVGFWSGWGGDINGRVGF